MVERDLAKVEVAGSSPVFRSESPLANRRRLFFEDALVVELVDTQDLNRNLSTQREIFEVKPFKFGEALFIQSELVIPSQALRIQRRCRD